MNLSVKEFKNLYLQSYDKKNQVGCFLNTNSISCLQRDIVSFWGYRGQLIWFTIGKGL